jgi:hypothetical protein
LNPQLKVGPPPGPETDQKATGFIFQFLILEFQLFKFQASFSWLPWRRAGPFQLSVFSFLDFPRCSSTASA